MRTSRTLRSLTAGCLLLGLSSCSGSSDTSPTVPNSTATSAPEADAQAPTTSPSTGGAEPTSTATSPSAPASTAGADQDQGPTGPGTPLVVMERFTVVPADWYEHVWFKAADSGGEVTYGDDGVTFTAQASNSRAGIMLDLEADVTAYAYLELHVVATVAQQTLTGTGWDAREAPAAVAVIYTDANGGEHRGLGTDPTSPANMFWRGFWYLPPDGRSTTDNGIESPQGQRTTFDIDLMTLDPPPAIIHTVALEGSGWQERIGTVHELSLTAYE